jgi:hypothetical protein
MAGNNGVGGGGMSKQNNDLLRTVQTNKRIEGQKATRYQSDRWSKRYSRSVPVSSPIYTTQRVFLGSFAGIGIRGLLGLNREALEEELVIYKSLTQEPILSPKHGAL